MKIDVLFPYAINITGINGGAANATIALSRALHALGHEVTLFHPGEVRLRQEVEGIRIYQFSPKDHIHRNSDAVLVAFSDNRVATTRQFSFGRQTIKAIVYHNAIFNGGDGQLMRFFRSWPDWFFVVSQYPAEQARRQGIPYCRVLPNGVSEAFRSSAPSVLSRDENSFLFAGALVSAKGVDRLLPAFARLCEQVPNAKLRLAGTARLWNRDSADFEIIRHPNIEYLGDLAASALATQYQQAQFVILPSEMESCGLSVMDGMWFGCIPVVTGNGALPELVQDGANGILIPELTTEGVVAALLRCCALDGDERRDLAEKARAFVEPITWERTARDLCSVLESGRPQRGFRWFGMRKVS